MSVIALRDLARATMLACGARGFMRFAAEGDALLVTDAAARCADGGSALCCALEDAGFACTQQGKLTLITPGDALLARLCAWEEPAPQVNWADALHPAQALAARFLREEKGPLTPAGRRFVMETARLCWQPKEKVLAGLNALRAQAAQLLREKDRSSLAWAGGLLACWCLEQMKEDAR